jgi:hypothetical protein
MAPMPSSYLSLYCAMVYRRLFRNLLVLLFFALAVSPTGLGEAVSGKRFGGVHDSNPDPISRAEYGARRRKTNEDDYFQSKEVHVSKNPLFRYLDFLQSAGF